MCERKILFFISEFKNRREKNNPVILNVLPCLPSLSLKNNVRSLKEWHALRADSHGNSCMPGQLKERVKACRWPLPFSATAGGGGISGAGRVVRQS